MTAPQNLRTVGDQIEQLLDELQATADPRTYERAAELLRLVSELYGAGLARVVELAADRDGGFIDSLVDDDLVASLLLVHGVHPETLARRVERALTQVRPFLASHAGDVELLDIDADAGAVLLRLLGSCDGCPSSSVTLQMAVERAITEAAPEIVRIEVEEQSKTSDRKSSDGGARGAPVTLGTKPIRSEAVYTSAAGHSTAGHSAAEHSAAEHSAAEHSAAEHSAAEHSAAEHSAAEHSAPGRSAAEPRPVYTECPAEMAAT